MTMCVLSANAQTENEMDKAPEKKGQMVEKRAEKLAEEFELKDGDKAKFVELFVAYKKELRETMPRPAGDMKKHEGKKPDMKKHEGKKPGDKKHDKKKSDDKKCDGKKSPKKPMKPLTDEEATKMLEGKWAFEQKQLEMQQARLNIEKKYSKEFSKMLTPQQMLRVFMSPNNHHKPHMQGQGGAKGGQFKPRPGMRKDGRFSGGGPTGEPVQGMPGGPGALEN